MSDLATISSRLPALSPGLDRVVDALIDPVPGVRNDAPAVPESMAREARAAAAALRQQCQPALLSAFVRWLAPVNVAVKNPQNEADFHAKCRAIAIACQDIPAACLTEATGREALRMFPFFPSAADVHAFFLPFARPLTARLRALDAIAAAPPEAPLSPPDQGQDAQAHVADVVRAFVSERTWNSEAPEDKPKVRPAYISDGALLSVHEKLASEGVAASQVRVEMIRQRMAAARKARFSAVPQGDDA